MPYKDPQAAKDRWRRYYKDNRKRVLEVQLTYKNRCRSRSGDGVTQAQWELLCAIYQGKCAHCGESKELTRDHLTPLSRGGPDEVLNVVPACWDCNRRHGSRLMCEWKPGSLLCNCPTCQPEQQAAE